MSIQKRVRKKGSVYVVHYYDTDAKKYVNKSFDRKTDATAFESIVNLAKRRGELALLDAGTETLNEFIAEWWERHGERFLAPVTQKTYRAFFKRFISPKLGTMQLRRITPSTVVSLRDHVLDESGDETARVTIALLQGVLERAVEWERIQINPVKAVKKPARIRSTRARALDPGHIERLVGGLDDRSRILIYLCGYGGLRPGEALGLEWGDIGTNVLSVSKSVSLGEVGGTKTGVSRMVRLLPSLAQDLNRFRLASGTRTGRLVTRADGQPWKDHDYRNWRKRTFQPAWAKLGGGVQADLYGDNGTDHERADSSLRVYDLRHSFASLLLHEGRNPAYIAEQMGHSIQTLLSTYIHIIEELRDAAPKSADELIKEARASTGMRIAGLDLRSTNEVSS